jgi:hypothetical protein
LPRAHRSDNDLYAVNQKLGAVLMLQRRVTDAVTCGNGQALLPQKNRWPLVALWPRTAEVMVGLAGEVALWLGQLSGGIALTPRPEAPDGKARGDRE